ncbi:MAG: adenylyltransferase/cytidyltransferase family protein [Candidatus Acidiferrales bacterium]
MFVAGVFDLMHPGHVRLLEQARGYGDVLVAAVLNDSSVRDPAVAESVQKSSRAAAVQRPTMAASERVEIVAALAAVDYAVEVSIDALPQLLGEIKPDTAVENGEPSGFALTAGAVKSGVNFVRIPFEPGHSTVGIIERIVQLSGSE